MRIYSNDTRLTRLTHKYPNAAKSLQMETITEDSKAENLNT